MQTGFLVESGFAIFLAKYHKIRINTVRGVFNLKLFELLSENELEDDFEFVNAGENQMAFALMSDDDADDALARILWAKSQLDKNNEIIARKKKQLQLQLEDYEKRLNGKLETYQKYYSELLNDYLVKKLDNKKGTVKLLHGNARLKEPSVSTEFDDEKVLIQYLKDNNLYDKCISVKESVRKTDLKKLFQKDNSGSYFVDDSGNVVPGVHLNKEEGLQLAITPAKM